MAATIAEMDGLTLRLVEADERNWSSAHSGNKIVR